MTAILPSAKQINEDERMVDMIVLLACPAPTSIVLLYHVLYRLNAQYTSIYFNLHICERAKYDLVIFLGELVLDNVLRPAPSSVHSDERR